MIDLLSVLLLSSFLLFASPRLVVAQGADGAQAASSPTLTSALRARAILERGIAAAGGLERLKAVHSSRRRIAGTTHDPGQSPHVVADSVLDPPAIERFTAEQYVDFDGKRLSYRRSGRIVGGQPYALHAAITTTAGFQENDTMHTVTEFAPASLTARFNALSRIQPEALLRAALDRPETLRYLGAGSCADSCDDVTYAEREGDQVTMSFDRRTGRLAAVRNVGTGASLGDQEIVISYEDWRSAPGGLTLPHRYHERRKNGVLYVTQEIQDIRINEGLPDSAFTRHATYGAEPPPAASVLEVGRGAYVLPGAYNSMLVVFPEFVVVVEPVSSEATTRVNVARIDSLAPGKPIRYVIASHFHYDHLAGIRGYVARGATILTTPDAEPMIRAIGSAQRELRPDGGVRFEHAAIEVVRARRVIEAGGQRLEIIPLSPTPHVDNMLVTYLPAQRVLFEGDLLDIPVPLDGTAMGGDDTRDLQRRITELGLDIQTIVPVHGRVGTMDDLRRAAARFTPDQGR